MYVTIQMDDIHVKSDISYKGGKIFGSNLDSDDPSKTASAIMVSTLYKKWSCIARLVPCATVRAQKLIGIIKSCIRDAEKCGLFVCHLYR